MSCLVVVLVLSWALSLWSYLVVVLSRLVLSVHLCLVLSLASCLGFVTCVFALSGCLLSNFVLYPALPFVSIFSCGLNCRSSVVLILVFSFLSLFGASCLALPFLVVPSCLAWSSLVSSLCRPLSLSFVPSFVFAFQVSPSLSSLVFSCLCLILVYVMSSRLCVSVFVLSCYVFTCHAFFVKSTSPNHPAKILSCVILLVFDVLNVFDVRYRTI